jgi:hypothetical protein
MARKSISNHHGTWHRVDSFGKRRSDAHPHRLGLSCCQRPGAVGVLALMIFRIVWWRGLDRKLRPEGRIECRQERTSQVMHCKRQRNDGGERCSPADLYPRGAPSIRPDYRTTSGCSFSFPCWLRVALIIIRSLRRSTGAHVVQYVTNKPIQTQMRRGQCRMQRTSSLGVSY